MLRIGLVVFVLVILLSGKIVLAECEDSIGDMRLAINYDYSDPRHPTWGPSGIPSEAFACWNGHLLAKAQGVEIDQTCGTPNCIRVVEEHFSTDGVSIYKGELLIQFGAMGGIQREAALRGRKNYNFFTSWP
jgi:hypothetical protein